MRLFVFKQRLQYKCDVNRVKYKEIDECYTSKTCTRCGEINNKLRSKSIFKCPNCDLSINRDINGARNIMMLNM